MIVKRIPDEPVNRRCDVAKLSQQIDDIDDICPIQPNSCPLSRQADVDGVFRRVNTNSTWLQAVHLIEQESLRPPRSTAVIH